MTKDADEPATARPAMTVFLDSARQCTAEQREAMEDALNRFSRAAPPGCPLALDTRFLKGLGRRTVAQNQLYHRGWRLAYLMATNVGDHLQAVGDVATDPPRLFAHMTLARASLEGAARVTYLLHPQGTTPDRVLRAAALLVASAEEEVKATAELPARTRLQVAAVADAGRRRGDIMRLLERADITVKRTKRDDRLAGVSWPLTPNLQTDCYPNITRLLKTLLPSKPAAYRIGSGAVHSQPWVLETDDAWDAARRHLQWAFDPAAFAGSVDLAVTASTLTMDAFAAMLGQDSSVERDRARRREQAVSRLLPSVLGG